MNDPHPTQGTRDEGSRDDSPPGAGAGEYLPAGRVVPEQDDLVEQVVQALRSREAHHPDPKVVMARVEARLARPWADTGGRADVAPVLVLARRGGAVAAAGILVSGLAVAGAGAAAAADPYSPAARTIESVAQAVGVDWSAIPEGYSRAQYEAFWGAGYTVEDAAVLGDLWDIDEIETKARAGQLLLNDQPVPIPPSGAAGNDTDQR